MTTRFLLILTLMVSVRTANGQQTPTLFEPGTISNDGVFGLTLSPDSDIALWVLSNGKRDSLRIMESRNVNGKWTKPNVASFSTSTGEWKDIDPMFSPDGNMVLFQSNRNTNRNADRKDFDIWAVVRTDSGWATPYRLEGNINSEVSESYASMTTDGTIYFMKENNNAVGLSDIYYSVLKDGKYQEPITIGWPINTTERESNPYISANGTYIIYFSSDKTGFGEVDLYISFRKNNTWTAPKNLGSLINTTNAEFCPFVHQKENRLYFSRQVKQADRFIENIYYINLTPHAFK